MASSAVELEKIIDRIRKGGIEDLVGFLSAAGMPTFQAPDPKYTQAERREWSIAFVTGWVTPDQIGWIERKGFRTPSDYFGPAGNKFMASVGMGSKDPERMFSAWRSTLERFADKTDAEIAEMKNEVSERYRNAEYEPRPRRRRRAKA
jgi:hypothetical protein